MMFADVDIRGGGGRHSRFDLFFKPYSLCSLSQVSIRDRNEANFLLPASSRPEKTSHRPDSPRAESLFCSPPRLDPI